MNTAGEGKVQIPKLILYCVLIIIGLLLIVGTLSSYLPAQLRMFTLAIPAPIGIILGILLYYRTGHELLEHDDRGFTLKKGRSVVQSCVWSEFACVSLCGDHKGGVNVRLYREPDGDYVDIPASRMGIDGFSLRNSVMAKLRKH